MPKMKKNKSEVNGQIVEQRLEDTRFIRDWQTWVNATKGFSDLGTEGSGSIYDFLENHIKNKRPGSGNQEGEGANLVLREVANIMAFDTVVGGRHLDLLVKMHAYLEESKGGSYDPGRILYHEKVIKDGKVTGKRKVYGHWRTAAFVKNNKKFGKPVPSSWYTYGADSAENPAHLALYSNGSTKFSKPKGLVFILADAIEELDKIENIVTIRKVRSAVDLMKIPAVRQYLESLMTGEYFKEGKLQGRKVANALSTQEFDVTDEKLIRQMAGLLEKDLEGEITTCRVETTPAVIEQIYMASKKRKAGGYYITGNRMDKRPRDKAGQPIAKSWLNALWRA